MNTTEIANPNSPAAKELQSQTAAKRVLIVEDHPVSIKILKRRFETVHHFQVDVADSLEQIQELLSANPDAYDLILIDGTLPNACDGFELGKYIRGKEINTPLIWTSANGLTQLQKEQGIFNCELTKPINMGKLDAFIQSIGSAKLHESNAFEFAYN